MHDAGAVRGAERIGHLRRVVEQPSSIDVPAIEQRSRSVSPETSSIAMKWIGLPFDAVP